MDTGDSDLDDEMGEGWEKLDALTWLAEPARETR